MKFIFITLIALGLQPVTWLGNFKTATEEAAKTHKLIVVNFSGSDWCGPCIRLRKEILESENFTNYAAANLILVRADFPRQRKISWVKNR